MGSALAPAIAQSEPAAVAFTLPPLPYAANPQGPAIDAQTMTVDHDKHHQADVDALKKALAVDLALAGHPLD